MVIETSGGGDAAGLRVSFAEGPVGACVPVDAPRQNESGNSGGGSDENR
ncbi:hypothetical protein [Allokutzneria oryzae]|uniref:Uncharacterized protein n=1 Tax=Allokutzneria oryzae TaxID=1378989 RepID=A0ABV5ZWW2_9PSEU